MKRPAQPRPQLVPTLRHHWFVVLLPWASLALAGCYPEPTRWDDVQKQTRHNAPSVAKDAVAGAMFNKLFPKPAGDYDIVYTQEKPGFAQAKLTGF